AADDAACGRRTGRGLVDGAVGAVEAVIGPVEVPPGVLAGRLGPALVLGLQDAAGQVAQPDQRGQALAGPRAARSQGYPAVDDRGGLSPDALADDAVFVDEEAAFGD